MLFDGLLKSIDKKFICKNKPNTLSVSSLNPNFFKKKSDDDKESRKNELHIIMIHNFFLH